MSVISDLLERVEKATGPDRELDCLIAVAIDGFFEVPPQWEGGPIGYGYIDKDGSRVEPGHGGDQLVRRYTASIDAALALVERKLRTYSLHMTVDPSGNGAEIVWWPNGLSDFDKQVSTSGASQDLPLAILAALLKALETP